MNAYANAIIIDDPLIEAIQNLDIDALYEAILTLPVGPVTLVTWHRQDESTFILLPYYNEWSTFGQ